MDWHKQAFYRVSVKALIRDPSGKILFVKEKGDLSIPGGGWDHGESVHECLVRELAEEISYHGDFTETLIHAQRRYVELKQAWLIWLTYDVDCDNLSFSAGVDAENIEWLGEDEIPDTPAGLMIMNALRARKGAL